MANVQIIKEKIKNAGNVEEPIAEIHKKIAESNESVLVLKGIRGSGKTTVLLEKEAKNKSGEEISIYNHFEHTGLGITSQDVGIDFIKHRFELEMASVLLRHINSNGISNESIKTIEQEIKKWRRLLIYDINNLGINESFESKILKPGHYTEYLLKEIKKMYGSKKISFLIDRFDWMFNRSIEAQECIRDYFQMFDQVVLTTDDENYHSKYPTIEVAYGKDKNIVKEIIKEHMKIKNGNKEIEKSLDFKNISEEAMDYIVGRANGDIEIVIRTINGLYSDFNCHSNDELNDALKTETDNQVKQRQKVKQMEKLKPRFYI